MQQLEKKTAPTRGFAGLLSLAGILGLTLLTVCALNGAAACTLSVTQHALTTANGAPCTDETIEAGLDTGGALQLAGLPNSCQGLPITLHTVTTVGGGTEISDVAGGGILRTNLVVSLPLTVRGVSVLINGWHIPTRWRNGSTVGLF